MKYQHDFFISYAHEDNADGFVSEFVDRLVNSPDLEQLLGAKPRIFLDDEIPRNVDDWEKSFELKSTRRGC